MTRTTAADRLDDAFPHGTPAGYRDGCRGNGGCPNRDTIHMTCKEADLRYHVDFRYRQAYDAGDIWLDREAPRAADTRATRVKRSGFVFGKPPVQPAATAAESDTAPEQTTTPPVEDAAKPAESQPLDVQDELEQARAENAALRRSIETLTQRLTGAEELAVLASRERAAALGKLDQALAVIEQQNQQPSPRPVIDVVREGDGGLRVSFAIAGGTVRLLADLAGHSA